jgi:hypothetical protein
MLALACKSNEAPATPEIVEAPMRTATLASGIVGGTYHDRYASEIDARVSDWLIAPRPTGGSSENLDLLSTGKVDLALSQADVYASRIAEEPDVFGGLRVLGAVGEECVFIARWIGGPVDSFDDLGRNVGDREALINVGTPDGGMFETWNYISSLVPENANADIDQSDGEAALVLLEAGTVDAVAWVTDPANDAHVLLKGVQGDPDLGFMVIADPRLEYQLSDGTEVYALRTIEIPGGGGVTLDTLCTRALLVAGPETDPALVESITAAGIAQ